MAVCLDCPTELPVQTTRGRKRLRCAPCAIKHKYAQIAEFNKSAKGREASQRYANSPNGTEARRRFRNKYLPEHLDEYADSIIIRVESLEAIVEDQKNYE